MVELLSHPGYYDLGSTDFDFQEQGIDSFIKSKNRKKELETLLDKELKIFIVENKIQLINFSGNRKRIF